MMGARQRSWAMSEPLGKKGAGVGLGQRGRAAHRSARWPKGHWGGGTSPETGPGSSKERKNIWPSCRGNESTETQHDKPPRRSDRAQVGIELTEINAAEQAPENHVKTFENNLLEVK